MPAAPLAADLELFVRNCSDCRKPIMWPWTTNGERMPVDADPVPNGNVIVYPDPGNHRRLLADVIDKGLRRAGMAADGWKFRQHHRLSCPHADRWARKPKAMRPKPTGIAAAPAVDTPPAEAGLW